MPVTRTRSQEFFEEARRHLPGGVNSPVRAFLAVGGDPLVFERARGSRIYDVDGNEYIDLVGSWGPMLLGHAHPAVVEAVRQAASHGLSFGATCAAEIEMALEIKERFPSIEMLRLVSSGTEATMSALRLARGFTGRSRIVKFEGCYHGHSDALLARAGSGVATLGLPDCAGVPQAAVQDTLVLPYNDIAAFEELMSRQGDTVAAVIVEPVAGNMGVVPPARDFLLCLRELTERHGALLIFDEIITGLRLSPGGAQELYGIPPDLTCLGKVLGGGLPLAAYGGSAEVMKKVAPLGPVYQAGTLSGNPVAVAAGLATLRAADQIPDLYQRLEDMGALLQERLTRSLKAHGIPGCVQRVGSMLTLFFTEGPVTDYASARRADTGLFARFFQGMLEEGVYLPPSQFEAAFLSAAHSREDIEAVAERAEAVLARVKG
ncbi:MAG TPA: glutamate-1-semialdehyde 2,1-aminomutase [Candidatus Nitrosotenuis sp.]|nr:glutamate-1-semialdehyde 2,1-aminomutase [Candidatus Nitrosotenuis sp.]